MTDLTNNSANNQGETSGSFSGLPAVRRLKDTVESISGIAGSQFNEIEAICKLAAASIENAAQNQLWVLEAVYHAIKSIQQKAYEADYLIGREAESAGITRTDEIGANIFRSNPVGGIQ